MKKRFISSFVEAKFLIARCLTLLILALLSTNLAWGEIVTLTENFSSSKATTNNYDCSSAITTADNQKDWNYAWTPGGSGTVFKNGIKLGKSGGTGSVSNSTMLADIPTGTSITIKIYAAVWNTDGGKVKFTYNGKDDTKDAENGAITSTTSAYSASDFASATEFSITKVEGVNEIKIESSQKRILIDKVEVIYDSAPTKIPTAVTVSGTPTKTSYFAGEEFDPAGLTVTATYAEGDEVVTSGITWSCTPETLTATTTSVTVTATVGGVKSSAYTVNDITVKNIANTQETAYTVAEAIALIDANPTGLSTTEVYVKGTVSKIVTAYSSDFGNITFDVSADGQTTGNQFQFYRNFKGAENEKWTSAVECPAVGDDVIGYGTMKKHSSTYEFDAGNYLVSHVKASTLEIKDITVEINGDITPVIETNVVGDYTMSYTSNNENVVLADGDEMVTMGLGTATITATLTAEGYKNATTTFTVEVIKALSSIEVKTAPTAVSYKVGDKFDPAGLVITAKYNDESTEDVAYAGNEDKFTFTPSLETALTTDVTSVTITYAGKEATQTITVRALYTYDITWMANGEEFKTTHVTEGDALALPTDEPTTEVEGYVFKGWINTENYYDAKTAPEYIVPADIIPTEAMRFYAVFAKEKAGETTTVTKDIIAEAGLSNSLTLNADVNPYQIGELPITLTGIKGTSNFPAINVNSTSGTDLRFYKGTTCGVTFATTNGQPITKIEFKKNAETASTLGNTFSANVGTLSANVWTGSAESVTISYSADATFKEQMYIINVTYSETSVPTYSNYCTTITAANMAITDAKWGTFCAPFDVALEEGVKAYTASEESGTIKFTEVDGTIEAGTPVVVYKDVTETYTKDYSAAVEDFNETCQDGALVGVYAATSGITAAANHTNYVLQSNTQGVGFYKVAATSTISLKANRCYMTLPASSAAKESFSFEDIITGINEILNPTKKSAEGIFDLNGRKLAAPQKGINIINGVKVIVK